MITSNPNIPIFVLNEVSFLGMGGERTDIVKLFSKNKERKLFGRITRFYVHGKLASEVGYDIAGFVAGHFENLPIQDALLVGNQCEVLNAKIVMVTANGTGNKYAFLVADNSDEIEMARRQLWNGEWLRDGWERF